MADYQHILLAVDFSDEDTYVARKAERLATFFNAKLSVIHILDNIPMPDTAYGTAIPLYSDSSYELLEIEKNKLIHTANRLTIDPTNLWLIWGKPEVEIIRIANQEDIDLIVVGSHGRHGLALLLGSTANGVLHHAQCDVLAVRLQDEWAESTILAYS
ncbi:universal stress protein [Nitrosomonas communis]|uniref:Universal stress protein n=1 Tax=Nitrosomonas communis TaxID=44574 RepID=A0A1I4NSL6_9PROT|nr:universal stress protein [Nitrosomonas communis]SFM18528.1 universal stress protein A [Nitrosomonas communis]